MRAGKLNKRVTIQKKDDAASQINGVTTWNDYATVWAGIMPLGGRQDSNNNNEKIVSELTHQINMRFLRGITADMRIVYQGRVFRIKSIRNLEEANRELEVDAIEKADI